MSGRIIALPAVAVYLALGVACADYELAAERGSPNAGNDSDADTVDEDSDTGDTGPSDTPTYWTLDGTLTITGGAVDPAGSALALAFRNGTEALCTVEPLTWTVNAGEAPADIETYGWWTLTLDEAGNPCEWPLPASMPSLGIGRLDERLHPAMAEAGHDPATTSLYGLYIQPDPAEATVYVYGVAGLPGNYDGSEAAVTAPPLPDGVYTLVDLHLLPL